MIIDFHTHAFPDSLAPKALASLEKCIGYPPVTDGTVSELLRSMRLWGIDRSVMCSIATNPRQTEKVNSFAIEAAENEPCLTCLGSVHPDLEDKESVLRHLKANGIKGIKIHPDYMGCELCDKRFDTIFELCSELDMFVITHAGVDPVSEDKVFCTPKMIRQVADRYPRLKLIGAHFGGNLMWDEVREYICGRNIWIDTSLAYAEGVYSSELKPILVAHSPDRILYGSDAPWCDSGKNVRFIEKMDLPTDTLEKIFYKNALELLRE